MADSDSWDADNFEPDEPLKGAAGLKDRWEGEDEEDDVKRSEMISVIEVKQLPVRD